MKKKMTLAEADMSIKEYSKFRQFHRVYKIAVGENTYEVYAEDEPYWPEEKFTRGASPPCPFVRRLRLPVWEHPGQKKKGKKNG